MLAGMVIGIGLPLLAYEKNAEGLEVLVGSKVMLAAGVFSVLGIICYILCYKLIVERVTLSSGETQEGEKPATQSLGRMLKSAITIADDTNAGVGGEAPAEPAPPAEQPSSSSGIICYIKQDTTLYKSASTSAESAASLEKGDKVLVTQVKSGWAKLFTQESVLGYLPSTLLSKTAVAASPKVILADWFKSDIQSVFPRGSVVKVIDVATGKAFSARRTGGLYHADAEPASESDTEKMLAVYGGQWSWDRRAIWVVIDGTYYAASMNGMGHGEDPDSNANNEFDGVFCIHFLNSRTHGTDNICPLHQAAIKQAYNAKP